MLSRQKRLENASATYLGEQRQQLCALKFLDKGTLAVSACALVNETGR
jgi:hypothetical protein